MASQRNPQKRSAPETERPADAAKRARQQQHEEREATHQARVEYAIKSLESSSRYPPMQEHRQKELDSIAALYEGLSPLKAPPSCVPLPEYIVDDFPKYSLDDPSRDFYDACYNGMVDEIQHFVQQSPRPPIGDLQYGLEKAAHAHEIEIVRYLLTECQVPLHACVFEGSDPPESSGDMYITRPPRRKGMQPSKQIRSIFGSGDKLLQLLSLLIDHGWHPNQSWQTPQWSADVKRMTWSFSCWYTMQLRDTKPYHSLAIDQEACLKDPAVVRLLLSHGADPTIGACGDNTPTPFEPHSPPERRSTDKLLKLAARIAPHETIELLVKHGARLKSSRLLHMAARRAPGLERPPGLARFNDADTIASVEQSKNDPQARFRFAQFILGLGEDINGLRDIGDLVDDLCLLSRPGPLKNCFATALSHAFGCRDWVFVEWLVNRGADPDAHGGVATRWFDGTEYKQSTVGWLSNQEQAVEHFKELVKKVKRRREEIENSETERGSDIDVELVLLQAAP